VSPTQIPDEDAVAARLALLDSPFGSEPHRRERERAAQWLLAHAERAYPVLLARLAAGRAGAGAVALLPRFGRGESVAVLARLLHGPELVAWGAGQALAQQPQSEAGAALRRALADANPKVATIAADALAGRGDPGDCPALAARLGAADPVVRYHVLQAADRLGCLMPAEIAGLAENDPDLEVRGLASQLLARRLASCSE
jgi:HEAT repeat protein